MDIHLIIAWFKSQNWFVLSFAIVGWLNVIIAGTRAMGWSALADFCEKLEIAIQAMVSAALNKNKGVSNAQANSVSNPTPPAPNGAGTGKPSNDV